LFSEREDAPQSEEPLDGGDSTYKKYENLAPSVMCIFKLKPFPAWRMTTKVITRVTHARKISIGQLESNVLARRGEHSEKHFATVFSQSSSLTAFAINGCSRLSRKITLMKH
jgi:hypothetical protein